jgi:protein SCO1/2
MMRLLILIFIALTTLVACDNKLSPSTPKIAFVNTDITGIDYAQKFSLTDHQGQARTLEDFRGKLVLLFFGYTQCPDVCPTTLSEMAQVMKLLDKDADKVQVLFVTIDPERDTPALLSRYVPSFYPSFLGLVGDKAATDEVVKEFKLFVQKIPAKTGSGYTIDHTAGSYLFDTQGHIRLFIRHGQGAEPIAQDIRTLLSTASGAK